MLPSQEAGLDDVVEVAWNACGRPDLELAFSGASSCARCARRAPLVPASKAVSRRFTGASEWVDGRGNGLCAGCAWSYREPALRRLPHHITPTAIQAVPAGYLLKLLQQPLPLDQALTVPLGGRKHLLPAAQWGRVTLDDAQIPWSSSDAARLGTVLRLRTAGATEHDLRRPTPPWPLLHRLDATERSPLMDDWASLDGWRSRTPLWLELAIIATRRNAQHEKPA